MKQGYQKKRSKSTVALHSYTTHAHGLASVTAKQGSFGCIDASTGAFSFSEEIAYLTPTPYGFIRGTQDHTTERALYDLEKKWERAERYQSRKRFWFSRPVALRSAFIQENTPEMSSRVGFKIKRFRSGEMSGGLYMTGMRSRTGLCLRSGGLETTCFTVKAKQKIRRAVECADRPLRYFCTLTFAPDLLYAWHKDESGVVRHDYAKYKLKKFLNTCRMQQSRLKRSLNYLWVAELQQNGNIHFHIIWDQFFPIQWLTKVWAQASNSVDIKKVRSVAGASSYLYNYVSKGGELIQGNRYYIGKKLHSECKPTERVVFEMSRKDNEETGGMGTKEILCTLNELKGEIESRGGTVMAYGFHISRPRKSKKYRDKETGEEKESKAVDPRLSRQLMRILLHQKRTVGLPF